jgi:hypothetical protein
MGWEIRMGFGGKPDLVALFLDARRITTAI